MRQQRAWDPGRWTFSVEEVSPGVPRRSPTMSKARYCGESDTTLDEALNLVERDAAEITKKRREASSSQ